jgi:hypothetical protein
VVVHQSSKSLLAEGVSTARRREHA